MAVKAVNEGLESFRIDEAAQAAYRFFWNEFCDWYLEIAKRVLRGSADAAMQQPALVPETRATLAYVLEASLRLLHPLIPFVTEELWQRVPKPPSRKISVAFGPFPREDEIAIAPDRREDVEKQVGAVQAAVSGGRMIRAEHDVHPAKHTRVIIGTSDPRMLATMQANAANISMMLKVEGVLAFQPAGAPREPGTSMTAVPTGMGPVEVLVGLKGLVERDAELARIDRELKKLEKDLAALDKKLGSPGFVDRAPKEVVEEAKQQRDALVQARSRLEAARELAREL